METLRWTDRLAKYIIYLAVAAAICALVWYFSDVVIYILVAGVLSLIGNPLANRIKKIHVKNHHIPDWAASILTILVIFGIFAAVVMLIVPIFSNLVRDIASMNIGNTLKSLSVPLYELNTFLVDKFPQLGPDFKVENSVLEQLQKVLSVSAFSSILGSVTSFLAGTGVALFSIVFISFFFFKEEGLFTKIITALVPDKAENEAIAAIGDIQNLLTRYFVGLLVEVCGVAIVNFIGLALIAKMGFNASISIAFLTGIMNIIPYVGPILGGALGVVIAVVMKYASPVPLGLDVNFWVFILILIAIFCVAQIIDNYFFQPVIYSNSIKAHPLEIFIVFLMAGHLGGILGMLVAVPCYTVIRAIAGRFFRDVKFIDRLIGEKE